MLNVLIVDDEPGDRTLERLALQEQTFECSFNEADSAEAALKKLAEISERLDVVLLDGHLEGVIGAAPVIEGMPAASGKVRTLDGAVHGGRVP